MDSEKLYELEKRIQRSKDLMVPSDTLRSRVVSEVLGRHSGKQITDAIGRCCSILLIGSAVTLMSVRSLDRWWDRHYHPVSSSEILHKANDIKKERHLETTESLAEAYSQWKSKLASHWKPK